MLKSNNEVFILNLPVYYTEENVIKNEVYTIFSKF